MAQSIAEIGDYYFVLPFFRSRVYRLATDPWHVAGPGGMRVAFTISVELVSNSVLGFCSKTHFGHEAASQTTVLADNLRNRHSLTRGIRL